MFGTTGRWDDTAPRDARLVELIVLILVRDVWGSFGSPAFDNILPLELESAERDDRSMLDVCAKCLECLQ